MRRVIDVLSILGLIAAPVSLGLFYSHPITPQSISLSTDISQKFPLNQPKLVEFQTDLAGFKQFSDRHQKDQLRDWLLLTVLSKQGLSIKEINQATYDLPTVRYDFMQPISNFEYGETRSLYVGKGRVIALVPKAASQAERMKDLTHIADRHHKDLGKPPTSLIVFEYKIQPDKQSAFLTKKEVRDTRKLFSSEYGYHEASIENLEDLRRFMAQIDDITSCTIQDNALLLSGRRIHVHPYQRATIEDIAAILQSAEKSKTQMTSFEALRDENIYGLPELQGDHRKSQQWQQIDFIEPGYNGSKTEAMPLLESESYQEFGRSVFFRSGVSLASKSTFERRKTLVLVDYLADLSRRSNLKEDSIFRNSEKLSSKTLDDTTFSLKSYRTLCKAIAQTKVVPIQFFRPSRLRIPELPRWIPEPPPRIPEPPPRIPEPPPRIPEPLQEERNALLKEQSAISEKQKALLERRKALLEKWKAWPEKRKALSGEWKALSGELKALLKEQNALLKEQRALSEKQKALPEKQRALSEKQRALSEKQNALPDDLADLSWRSNINYHSISRNPEKLSFQTFGETTFSLKNVDRTLGTSTAQAKVGTKFRSSDAELANQVVSRNVSQTRSGLQIDTKIGGTDFGTFGTTETQNGFAVGFLGRDMDNGYSLFSKVSSDPRVIHDPQMIATVLQENPYVQAILKTGTIPPVYFVKTVDAKQWVKATLETTTGGGSKPPLPPKDWQMLVGDLEDGSRNFRLAWIDDRTVQKKLEAKELKSIYKVSSEDTSGDTFGFAQDWGDFEYQEIAQKLLDRQLAFFQFKEEHLKANLNKIDRFLIAQDDVRASQILDSLIKQYGPVPNLILRRAVINIRKGMLNVKQIFSKKAIDKNNFLDEINRLLSRGNLRIARYETGKGIFYVQDDPRLNNVDWNIPFDKSIPSGSGARVYQVLPGEIGKVKLHLNGLGDSSSSFHSSTQFQDEDGKYVSSMTTSLRAIATNNSYDCNIASDNDKNNHEYYDEKCLSEKQNLEKPVYIVIIPK